MSKKGDKGRTPRGSCNNTLLRMVLRRVLRRFFNWVPRKPTKGRKSRELLEKTLGKPIPNHEVQANFSDSLSFCRLWLGGHFGPEKKYLDHPPQIPPMCCRPPSRPLGPSRPGDPPPWDFQLKIRPPPTPQNRGLPIPPPRAEKNKKYPKCPPSWCLPI